MKTIFLMSVIWSALISIGMAQTPAPTPCLTADDVKAFRQALADRDFYKQRAENAEAMNTAITASRDSWKALYEGEKVRADTIQGGRINELQKANEQLHIQADADKQKIGEQNAEIIRLKSGRKWYFLMGAGVGGIGGYFVGKNIDKAITLIPGQSRPQFGTSFSF